MTMIQRQVKIMIRRYLDEIAARDRDEERLLARAEQVRRDRAAADDGLAGLVALLERRCAASPAAGAAEMSAALAGRESEVSAALARRSLSGRVSARREPGTRHHQEGQGNGR